MDKIENDLIWVPVQEHDIDIGKALKENYKPERSNLMGTLYYVVCHDCKIFRDLDKYMGCAGITPHTRKEMIEYSEQEIEKRSFRYALLISFLIDHSSHNCSLANEHEVFDLENGHGFKKETIKFWEISKEETIKPKGKT